MKITQKQAKEYAKLFNINLNVVPIKWWTKGMNIELEHGSKIGFTNVTHDNLFTTAQIALAHLIEIPDYYQRLEKMEKQGDKYWSKKDKNIFNQ